MAPGNDGCTRGRAKVLAGVTYLRLDASVVACHSEKEGAEPNFKGFGLHPLGGCATTPGNLADQPLAGVDVSVSTLVTGVPSKSTCTASY